MKGPGRELFPQGERPCKLNHVDNQSLLKWGTKGDVHSQFKDVEAFEDFFFKQSKVVALQTESIQLYEARE